MKTNAKKVRPDAAIGVPKTRAEWDRLHTESKTDLKARGMGTWSDPDPDGYVLMLIPHAWYDKIPVGFPLTCISGKTAPHAVKGDGKTDDDVRFGCLAYGVKIRVR